MKKQPPDNSYSNSLAFQKLGIRTREKIYRILETSLDLICVLDKAGVLVMVSPSCEKLLGYTEGELTGKCCCDFIVEADRLETLEIGELIANGNEVTDFVNRYIKKDGSIMVLMWSASYDAEEGLMYCIGRDITALKKAREEVEKSNERFYYASKATTDVIWDWDLGNNLMAWGENYYTLFGYEPEKEKQHVSHWYIKIHPADSERVINGINNVIADNNTTINTTWLEEYRYKKADGSYRWVADNGIVLRDESGKAVRMIGAMKDISNRKIADEMLLLSEQRFRSLVQDGSDMIAILNADGDYTYVSPTVQHILGFSPDYFIGKNAFQFIHPDDVERAVEALKSIFEKKSIVLEPFRFKDISGEWKWIETKLTDQFCNESIKGIIANSRDITENKNNEDKIRTLAILAKETINAMSISDLQGNITWANNAFLKTYGYKLNEVVGNKSEILLTGPKTSRNKIKEIQKLLSKNQIVDTEMVLYTKSGLLRIVELQIQPLFDEKGIPKNNFAVHYDITEKRRLQLKLQREVKERQQMITKAVLAAQEKDREKIARELHDNVSQLLTTVKLYLEICTTDKKGKENLLPNSINLLNKSIDEIRNISHMLSYNSIKEKTLKEALDELTASINLAKKCQVHLKIDGDLDESILAMDFRLTVYRIIQEQLNNTLKHAEATVLEVKLCQCGDTLQIEMRDNGKGFDPVARKNGIGLTNIESRVFAYRGKMEMTTAPGKGCSIQINFPAIFGSGEAIN
ncbi:MAG: sensor histidine kinase [Chitinophagaceae bacterium]